MRYYDIVEVLQHLIKEEGLIFPGSQSISFDVELLSNLAFKSEYINDTTNESHFQKITEEDWNNMAWNPPLYQDPYGLFRYSYPQLYEPDPTASPKPTWADLLRIYNAIFYPALLLDTQQSIQGDLQFVCEEKIREKYGAETYIEELRIRNRKAGTSQVIQGDKWRDHYRARYREIKNWVYFIATYEQLIKYIDFSDPELWDKAYWIMPFTTERYTGGTPDEDIVLSLPDPPIKK